MKRKKYSNKLKAKVAVAAIKRDRTANEIVSEFGIHVSQVNRWKKEAVAAKPGISKPHPEHKVYPYLLRK